MGKPQKFIDGWGLRPQTPVASGEWSCTQGYELELEK